MRKDEIKYSAWKIRRPTSSKNALLEFNADLTKRRLVYTSSSEKSFALQGLRGGIVYKHRRDEEVRISSPPRCSSNPGRSRIYYQVTQRDGCIRDASIIVFDSSQVPRYGRSIGGGSESKTRFHDPNALACRGLMHPFVGGIASASPCDPPFSPRPVPLFLRRISFSSLSTAASHPRSHKRFYDLHPVRVRGRYSRERGWIFHRARERRAKMNSAAAPSLRK